ncbi:MAG: beta-galactosidase [Oligosphaeraceae bacterium]
MKRLPFLAALLLSLLSMAQQWNFRQDNTLQGFRPMNFISYEMVPGTGFHGIGHHNAYFIAPEDLALTAEDYDYLVVDYEGDSPNFPVYFSHDGDPLSEKSRLDCTQRPGKNQLIFPTKNNPLWRDTITHLRFDVVLTEEGEATIHQIRLCKELPTELDGVQIPNGDFQEGGAGWEGDAEISYQEAVIPPGGTLVSPWAEVTYIGKYLLDADLEGDLQADLEFRDILRQPLPGQKTSLPGTLYPPAMAADARVRLVNATDQPAILRRLSLVAIPGGMELQDARQDFLAGKSFTIVQGGATPSRGNWLWEESLVNKEHGSAVFLRNFAVEEPEALKEATLYLTADNVLQEVLLNDTPLPLSLNEEWRLFDAVPVKSLLRKGENTLRVKVLNLDGPGGLLGELHLVPREGSRTILVTDQEWKVRPLAPGEEKGAWKTLEVRDTPLLLGPNGCSPWGSRSIFLPLPRGLVATGLDLPATVPEDGLWTPAPVLRLGEETTQDTDLYFSLVLREGDRNFLAATTVIPRGALEGRAEYPLPETRINLDFLPPGTYQLATTLNQWEIAMEGNRTLVVPQRPKSDQDPLPAVQLVETRGVPKLLINGQEKVTLTQYLIDMVEGDLQYQEIQRAADNGVPGLWLHLRLPLDEEGNPVFSNLDNVCTTALLRNPELHLVLIVGLDPMRHPSMLPLLQKDPRTLIETADGDHTVRNYSEVRQYSPSLASTQWLDISDRILRQVVDHLREMPYGRRVVAILPSAGITWEWMYWGCQKEGEFVDYSPAFREAFVRFAQKKYATVEEANQAWNTSFSSFQEILEKRENLPMPDQRMDFGNPAFLRLPGETQMVMDYNRCMAEVVADAIIHLCRTVKTATDGKLLAGAYYGYLNLITHTRFAQHSGHWALSKTLAAPEVELYHAPTTYNDRGPGGAAGFMVPDASIRQAGKVFVTESDIRTIHSDVGRSLGGCITLAETKAVLIREVAACLSHGVAMRYYDFSQGWVFKDPRLGQLVGRLSRAEQEVVRAEPVLDDPAQSMAVLVSENAMEHVTYNSAVNHHALTAQYEEFPRSGVAFADYVIPRLDQVPLGHKLWFFETPYRLSPEDVDYIQENILVPGNTVIFALGADVVRKDHFSTETLERLTGMTFRIDQENTARPTAFLTPEGEAALGFPQEKNYPGSVTFFPVFRPVGDCEILARDDQGNPVLAQNSVNGCRVLFSSLPRFRASWLRAVAMDAGIHCYNDTPGDITWAAGPVMGFHFPKAGERTLRTPAATGVARELISGQEYPIQDGSIFYNAEKGSSALFLVLP